MSIRKLGSDSRTHLNHLQNKKDMCLYPCFRICVSIDMCKPRPNVKNKRATKSKSEMWIYTGRSCNCRTRGQENYFLSTSLAMSSTIQRLKLKRGRIMERGVKDKSIKGKNILHLYNGAIGNQLLNHTRC